LLIIKFISVNFYAYACGDGMQLIVRSSGLFVRIRLDLLMP
jgi:hypothetical protein